MVIPFTNKERIVCCRDCRTEVAKLYIAGQQCNMTATAMDVRVFIPVCSYIFLNQCIICVIAPENHIHEIGVPLRTEATTARIRKVVRYRIINSGRATFGSNINSTAQPIGLN